MTQQPLFTGKEYRGIYNKARSEEKIQLAVCKYLKIKYPNVIFMCDLASGLKMTLWMGARHKIMRSSRGLPDLFIAHPRPNPETNRLYNGLFLELKKDGTRIVKRNGQPASQHIGEQMVVLSELRKVGYSAQFACGYKEAIKIIDEYMG